MSWNHRVMRHIDPVLGEEVLQIHEVYYDDDGKPNRYTLNPVSVSGADIDELYWVLERMKEALIKPILNKEDCGGGSDRVVIVEPST